MINLLDFTFKILSCCMAILVLSFPSVAQKNAQLNESYLTKIEKGLLPNVFVVNDSLPFHLLDRMEHYGAVGYSLTTIKNFNIEETKGYGLCRSEDKLQVDSKSIFRAGSISKSVTAIVALKLQEQGLLNIDEDIRGYLKSWKLPNNKWIKKKTVSIRNLLVHKSGLKGAVRMKMGDEGYIEGDRVFTLNEILNGESPLHALDFDSEPGEVFKYSNQGYNLIQKVIEDITGKKFEDLAEKLVLAPFNMSNSTFQTVYPDSLNINYCYAYKNNVVHDGFYHNTVEKCAGGLFSTTEDLAVFMIKVAKIVAGKDDFIQQDLAKQIFQGNDYGLGFNLIKSDGLFLVYHTGRTSGFYSFMALDPKMGEGFAMMVNSDGVDDLFREVLRSISNTFNWNLWNPISINSIDVNLEEYKKHLGMYICYEEDDDFKLEIIKKNDQLFYLEFDDKEVYEFPLVPISKNVFMDGIDGNKLEFIEEHDKIIGLKYDDQYLFEKE